MNNYSPDPLDSISDVKQLLMDTVASCSWPELNRYVSAYLIDCSLPNIAILPLAACASVGGLPFRAAAVSCASLLLVLGTRWLDDLADRDRPDALWTTVGVDQTIVLASGALMLAWHQLAKDTYIPRQVLDRFGESTLRIAAGQYLDLTKGEIDVETTWKILRGKTASGYSFMCESGGWMAGATKNECSLLAKVGEHLGVMIQLLDDLDGVFAPDGQGDLATQKYCNAVIVHGLHGHHSKEVRDLLMHKQAEALSRLLLESGSASAVLAAAIQERTLALQTLEAIPPKSGEMAALGSKRLANFAYGVFSQLPAPIIQWIEVSQCAIHVQGKGKRKKLKGA